MNTLYPTTEEIDLEHLLRRQEAREEEFDARVAELRQEAIDENERAMNAMVAEAEEREHIAVYTAKMERDAALAEAQEDTFEQFARMGLCPWCEPAAVGPAILDLFRAAPKMKALNLPGLRIGRAGHTSSNPGGLWVTDGGAWGESVYYGRIDADGSFRARAELTSDLRETLRRLAAFGAEEIARIGRATGRCCYCDRFLDDPISVELGYGPVCAKHHNLPHGKKAVA